MKKFIKLIVVLFILFIPLTVFCINDDSDVIKVTVNGTFVVFQDQQPIIENERTYIPVRTVSECLGATVGWNDKSQTATIYRDQKYLAMAIGNSVMVIDNRKTGQKDNVQMDVTPILVGDRVMAPIRYVVEAFGGVINYDEVTNTVIILFDNLEKRGNTIGNQANFANDVSFTFDKKYLYIPIIVNVNNPNMKNPTYLFKMNFDGANKKKLSEFNQPNNINYYNGWIYYSTWKENYFQNADLGKNQLLKTNIDGTETIVILDNGKKGDFKYICVINDYIYFTKVVLGEVHSLYKIPIEGGPIAKVFEPSVDIIKKQDNEGDEYVEIVGDIDYYCIADEWIYFCDDFNDSKALYKIKLDGLGKNKISDDYAYCINVINGWVYFITKTTGQIGTDYYRDIYKVRTDGGDRKLVHTEKNNIHSINVVDDWIYFIVTKKDGNALCKVNCDGSGYTVLISKSDLANGMLKKQIFIANNNIYFIVTEIENNKSVDRLYSIKTDGSDIKIIVSKLLEY